MEQRKSWTLFVLVLEIAAIAILHTVKIFHSEKTANNSKETSRNISSAQPDNKMKSSISLTEFK